MDVVDVEKSDSVIGLAGIRHVKSQAYPQTALDVNLLYAREKHRLFCSKNAAEGDAESRISWRFDGEFMGFETRRIVSHSQHTHRGED